mgnify:CR=1 FL=1|jgi:transcriptional regulator with XRE-family HTH domain
MAVLKVKQIAKDKGLTMAKVAELMKVHPVNLSTTLNGNPTLSTLCKVAEVLGVEVSDLFETTNKPSIEGFVKVDNEIIEIHSVSDLERATEKAKSIQ